MKSSNLLIILTIFISFTSTSQKKIPRYGKIDKKVLIERSNENYPGANGYYIFDSGETYFEIDKLYFKDDSKSGSLFTIVSKRHFRIKILKEEALYLGEIIIPFYRENQTKEKVYNIKATTYNMKDGKLVKAKLPKDLMYTEEISENWSRVKFKLPEMEIGSIIEVTYTISSQFLDRNFDWQFQYEIPVLHSKFDVLIPEYYKYRAYESGNIPIIKDVSTKEKEVDFANVNSNKGKYIGNMNMTNTSKGRNLFKYYEDNYIYIANNIPAMIEENYITTTKNYISKLEFELLSIQIPGNIIETYTTNWASVSKTLYEYKNLGNILKSAIYITPDAEMLKKSYSDDN